MSCILNRIVQRTAVVAVLIAGTISSAISAAGVLYRYHNDNGTPVINHQIPPEYVERGYDILSSDGNLLRTVPRALSAEELQERSTDESKARYAEREALRMRAWDESLLLRYSSTEDIDAAQQRAMKELNIRVSILKSNLSATKSQIERGQLEAANIERRGAEAPAEMTGNIEIMKLEIEDIEQSIVTRREEIAAMKVDFERDKTRFESLHDQVRMRRQPLAPSSATAY
ncbi:MAG: hypothetical protein ACI9WS_001245 [Paraglaciecola psychrophila]